MLATTWVQIIKAVLLMAGSILLSILVMGHFGFSFAAFFEAISHVTYHVKGEEVTRNFLEPGLKFGAAVTNGWGPLDLVSLGLALVFGTAGSPAHSCALLYSAGRQDGSHFGRMGHAHHWAVLYHDDLSRVRRGHHSHAGPHRRRWQAQRQHGRSAPRPGARWRGLLCFHLRRGFCHHIGGRFGANHLGQHLLCARFLYKCYPSRKGTVAR